MEHTGAGLPFVKGTDMMAGQPGQCLAQRDTCWPHSRQSIIAVSTLAARRQTCNALVQRGLTLEGNAPTQLGHLLRGYLEPHGHVFIEYCLPLRPQRLQVSHDV